MKRYRREAFARSGFVIRFIGALGRRISFSAGQGHVRKTIPKAVVEQRLGNVRPLVLVGMGAANPDSADPEAEARFFAGGQPGELIMVEGAGRYPQDEMP